MKKRLENFINFLFTLCYALWNRFREAVIDFRDQLTLEDLSTDVSQLTVDDRLALQHRLTDAEAEVANVTAFAQVCSHVLSDEAYSRLLNQKLTTATDREAFNTLVSLGVSQNHAQFVCNYFLAQNVKYPGELIVLSSQSYVYSHNFLSLKDEIELEIYELWNKNYDKIIASKHTIHYWIK